MVITPSPCLTVVVKYGLSPDCRRLVGFPGKLDNGLSTERSMIVMLCTPRYVVGMLQLSSKKPPIIRPWGTSGCVG